MLQGVAPSVVTEWCQESALEAGALYVRPGLSELLKTASAAYPGSWKPSVALRKGVAGEVIINTVYATQGYRLLERRRRKTSSLPLAENLRSRFPVFGASTVKRTSLLGS